MRRSTELSKIQKYSQIVSNIFHACADEIEGALKVLDSYSGELPFDASCRLSRYAVCLVLKFLSMMSPYQLHLLKLSIEDEIQSRNR